MRVETKDFKVGDAVRVISSGETYTTNDTKFKELGFKDTVRNPYWNNGEEGVVFVTGRTDVGVCGVRHKDGRECLITFKGLELITVDNQKEVVTYSVTRGGLKEIFDIACAEWKTRIVDITLGCLGSFKDEGRLPEKIVQSMRDAATPTQIIVIDRLFPKPKVKKVVEVSAWINVYPDGDNSMYEDKAQADGIAGKARIACVEVKGTYEIEE